MMLKRVIPILLIILLILSTLTIQTLAESKSSGATKSSAVIYQKTETTATIGSVSVPYMGLNDSTKLYVMEKEENAEYYITWSVARLSASRFVNYYDYSSWCVVYVFTGTKDEVLNFIFSGSDDNVSATLYTAPERLPFLQGNKVLTYYDGFDGDNTASKITEGYTMNLYESYTYWQENVYQDSDIGTYDIAGLLQQQNNSLQVIVALLLFVCTFFIIFLIYKLFSWLFL